MNEGDSNPNWRGGKRNIKCDQCGDKIQKYPSEVKDHNFCSVDCKSNWQSSRFKGEKNPRFSGGTTKEEYTCDNCGNKFMRPPSNQRKRENDFCSRECWNEWRTGENHPRWNGGKPPYYGENWREMRRKVRKRDDYTCQVCGISEEDVDKQLDVHHIQPIATFEIPENANTLHNLVTVCRSCHLNVEGSVSKTLAAIGGSWVEA